MSDATLSPAADPVLVQVGPHSFVNRTFAAAAGLRAWNPRQEHASLEGLVAEMGADRAVEADRAEDCVRRPLVPFEGADAIRVAETVKRRPRGSAGAGRGIERVGPGPDRPRVHGG